jgi:hypothetical protein
MKIQKFNESNLTNDTLKSFIENIVEYFHADDDGNVAIYYSQLSKYNRNKFFLEFQCISIEKDALDVLLKIYNYIESFDNESTWKIFSEHVDDDLDATCFHIVIDIDKFEDINDDLQAKLKSVTYNI